MMINRVKSVLFVLHMDRQPGTAYDVRRQHISVTTALSPKTYNNTDLAG